MDRLRVGVIGTGFMGGVHVRALRAAGQDVACIAASSADRAAAAARSLGVERSATAHDLIAADDVDVVHVCTPNSLHAPLAREALAAGKHVVCEKPLATTVDDALELTRAAGDAAVTATVPFVYRFYPTVREARSRIADGWPGPLRLVHGAYLQDWLSTDDDTDWRQQSKVGGPSRAFADIGVHWCDLAEFVTGQRITALTAQTYVAPRSTGTPDTEDAVGLLFRTDGDAMGSLTVSQISSGQRNALRLVVDGARESYAFDQEQPETLWVGTRGENKRAQRGAEGESAAAARLSILPPGHPQGYLDCFTAFVRDTYAAIAGEDVDGLPRFADGLRGARITDAVLRSARTHEWTEVPT